MKWWVVVNYLLKKDNESGSVKIITLFFVNI